MNRKIFTLSAFFLCLASVMGARTIKDLFIDEPETVFPLLSKSTKMDMIDYLNSGQPFEAETAFGKGTKFNRVTDNYMSVQVSSSSNVELLLLPVSEKDSIIVVVSTFSLPAKDSHIEIYTTKWEKCRTRDYLKEPTMKDFVYIPKGNKTKKKHILEALEFPVISYSINPENGTLTVHHGLKDYMSKEDYDKIAPCLKDSLEIKLK